METMTPVVPGLSESRRGATEPIADPAPPARGGLSLIAALTGALVTYAAVMMFVLAARAVSSYVGYKPYRLPIGGARGVGLTAAIAIGAGLLVAFLWGGYTAGRMARGAGWLNGIATVIAVALIAGIGLGAALLLAPGPGLNLHLRLPAGYPKISFHTARWMLAASGAAIALVGGALGAAVGARWHTRLERRALKELEERREARESFADLREAMSTPAPAPVMSPTLASPADILAPGPVTPARP